MWREVRDWLEELSCRAGFDGLPVSGRTIGVAAGVVVALLAGIYVLRGRPAAQASLVPTPARASAAATSSAVGTTAPAAPEHITVHVVGEVRHPGVYELSAGSRAADAVEAAGGLLGDADQASVNLARVVMDGEQIAVPKEGEAVSTAPGATGGPATAGAPAGGQIDLNTATVEQLDTLPGIGPSTAQKIVSDRASNGPFRTVDDLMRVPGVGPAKLDALKGLVTTG